MNNTEHIIKSCGFSEEMERYLISCEYNEYGMIDIILGAPIPLVQKRGLVESLYTPNSKNVSEISTCLIEIDEALEALKLKDHEVFTLSECWYDEDYLEENNSSAELFLSFQAVMNRINKMLEEDAEDLEEGEDYICWTEIIKWVRCFNGEMEAVYSYVFVGNEIYYFKRIDEDRRKSFLGLVSSMDLNLAVPFKVGDIVTLDCLPFAPVKQVIITEAQKYYDCCGVQILYQQKCETSEKTEWKIGSLKHGHGWNHYYPMLSPLYRLSTFEGELPEEERLMKDVQQYVLKDEENGRKLWEFMCKSNPNEKEIYEYLKLNT